MMIKFWTGESRADRELFKFWGQTMKLLRKDEKLRDDDWIKARRAQLSQETDKPADWAYGRAHLEDYIRHKAQMDDGRLAARLPVYGISREELIALGIQVDNLRHEPTGPENDADYIVILPRDWSLEAVDGSEREAGVYDGDKNRVLDVLYSNKLDRLYELHPLYGSFRSVTSLAENPGAIK
ncbi:MAG TPA: hypothetical protein VGM08_02290 [Candidatus Saccharimonadales bacterium]|jgi:hypothetical protein